MPRYVVERTFSDGWPDQLGPSAIERNADEGVTWLHSYVSEERRTWFCVYDAPSPEAIRKTAVRNGLPVDRISQVLVLEPYPFG